MTGVQGRPRRLLVVRHAKAEPFGATDHARPLTDRGVQAARELGRHLRDIGLVPERALVSSAVRTRQTWAAMAETIATDATAVDFDDALFAGSPDVVLAALQQVPEDARTVLFVGHNPTAAYLCHLLDDGDGDPEAVSGMLQGFPPGALTVLEVDVPWASLAAETGRVVGYHVGG